MTMVDTGVTGAKRQSWHATNPRELLKRLIEENPKWDKERVLRTFSREVTDNRRYIDTIVEYWFANNYHSLIERPARTYRARQTREATEQVKAAIKNEIEHKATVMLLELNMPNGKLLRDCTGAECSKLSSKIGGWLLRISKRIKPNQTVGSALTEQEVRDFYAKS